MKIHKLSILIFFVCLGFFAFANSQLAITDPVESNYALTAMEMVQSGNWLSPQIYHQFWYDKPIMIYWLIAISYTIFGFGEFAARFPSAFFSALTVAFLYQFIRNISNRRIMAAWGAMILGTSLEFWIIAHAIITDAVLIFATLGIMGFAYLGLTKKSVSSMTLAYAFAGLAVLTKGPVGIVLPGLVLIVYAVLMRSWDYGKRLFPWQGIVAFAIVALPWYVMMYVTHGSDFITGFLGLHNYVRATVSEHPGENVWWYYLAILPLSFLPWTGPVLYEMWAGRKQKQTHSIYLYLMVWGWVPILFYSLVATKYPTYSFISMLPFSVLGAIGMVRLCNGHLKRWRVTILTGPAILWWGALIGASFFIDWGFWYLLYVIAGGGIFILLMEQWRGKKPLLPVIICVVTILSSAVVIHEGLIPLMDKRSDKSISNTVMDFEGKVYYYGEYSTSLVYYTGKNIARIDTDIPGRQKGVWAGKYTMPFVTVDQARQEGQSHEKILVIVPERLLADFKEGPLGSLFKEYKIEKGDVLFQTK